MLGKGCVKDMQELIVQIDWLEHQLDQLKKLESIAADERQKLCIIVAQLAEMDGRTLAECRMEIRNYIRRLDEIEGSTAGLRHAIGRVIIAFEEAERLNKEEFEGSRFHGGKAAPIQAFIPGEREAYPFITDKKEGLHHTPENDEEWNADMGVVAFELFDRWARIARRRIARPHFRDWLDGIQMNSQKRISGAIRKGSRIPVPDLKVLLGAPKDVLFLCSAKRLDVPDWLNERY